jgi:hypothetical protein
VRLTFPPTVVGPEAYTAPALSVSILKCHSATKRDRHVATVRSQGATVQDIQTNLIWCSEMRTKLWLVRQRSPPDRGHRGVVPRAQARKLHHICTLPVANRVLQYHASMGKVPRCKTCVAYCIMVQNKPHSYRKLSETCKNTLRTTAD